MNPTTAQIQARTDARHQLLEILRTLRYAQTRLARRHVTADHTERARLAAGLHRLGLTQSAINRMAGDYRALDLMAVAGFAAARTTLTPLRYQVYRKNGQYISGHATLERARFEVDTYGRPGTTIRDEHTHGAVVYTKPARTNGAS